MGVRMLHARGMLACGLPASKHAAAGDSSVDHMTPKIMLEPARCAHASIHHAAFKLSCRKQGCLSTGLRFWVRDEAAYQPLYSMLDPIW